MGFLDRTTVPFDYIDIVSQEERIKEKPFIHIHEAYHMVFHFGTLLVCKCLAVRPTPLPAGASHMETSSAMPAGTVWGEY